MATIYALLIGINQYPDPLHQLLGCLNDVAQMDCFLRKYATAQNLESSIIMLRNDNATRQSIINAFSHFDQAQDGDSCLFFYSGHGSQASAPAEFWYNANQLNESIVCHDSRLPGGWDLMDKELAYLIWKATTRENGSPQNRIPKKVHFLAVMDCCHSGSSTRNLSICRNRKAPPNHNPKTAEQYEGYFFYEKGNGKVTPPMGNHVMLAASRDNEFANERMIDGMQMGAFTYSLLQALNQGGIYQTYEELLQRTRIRIQQLSVAQHPQLELVNQAERGGFMGGKDVKGMPYLVHFDAEKKTWLLDGGSLQGIGIGTETNPMTFHLEDGTVLKALGVRMNETLVDGMDGKDISATYEAWVKMPGAPRLPVFIDTSMEAGLKKKLETAFHDNPKIHLAPAEDDSQYSVRIFENSLILTRSGDEKPVFKRVPLTSETCIEDFTQKVSTVGKWESALLIKKLPEYFDAGDVLATVKVYDDIHLYKDEHPYTAYAGQQLTQPVPLQVLWDENKWRGQVWEVSIKNQGTRDFWINAVYFDAAFGIETHYQRNIRLAAGKEMPLTFHYNDKLLRKKVATIDEAYSTWGQHEISDYLKIFISTKEMNRFIPAQPNLPLDVALKSGDKTCRSFVVEEEEYGGDDWAVVDVEFKILTGRNK
jgi:hypothetical protein